MSRYETVSMRDLNNVIAAFAKLPRAPEHVAHKTKPVLKAAIGETVMVFGVKCKVLRYVNVMGVGMYYECESVKRVPKRMRVPLVAADLRTVPAKMKELDGKLVYTAQGVLIRVHFDNKGLYTFGPMLSVPVLRHFAVADDIQRLS